MIFLLLSALAFAGDIQGEEIWTAPVVLKVEQAASTKPENKVIKSKHVSRSTVSRPQSNIPNEYLVSISRESNNSELIQPPKGSSEIFRGIKVGDIIEVKVSHSVIAFPDEKAPVLGAADNGQLSGFRFVGESYLEKNTKRIFINISRLVMGQQVYEVKGVGVSGLHPSYWSLNPEN